MNTFYTRQFTKKSDATGQAKHLTRQTGVKFVIKRKVTRDTDYYLVMVNGGKAARAKVRRFFAESDVYAGVA